MMMRSASDEELLGSVASGDEKAFTLLFRRRRSDIYRFAFQMTGASPAADDITQEVFVTVMRDAARYEPGRSTVKAWMCGIARNLALRHLNSARNSVALPEGEEAEALLPATCPDPLADLTRAEQVDALRKAIATLPVAYREAVVLCDLQELSYRDVAAAIGCSIGTVRSRLHRGRALLAAKMSAYQRASIAERGNGARCFA